MKIPRDLKPNDRLWYSKTEYAVVAKGAATSRVYQAADGDAKPAGIIALAGGKQMRYSIESGVELLGDTPPIIRIERIASAPKKVKASAADRLIDIAHRCVRHVNPKAYAGELAKTKPMADCYLNTLLRRAVNAAKRERAIARRLDGGAS